MKLLWTLVFMLSHSLAHGAGVGGFTCKMVSKRFNNYYTFPNGFIFTHHQMDNLLNKGQRISINYGNTTSNWEPSIQDIQYQTFASATCKALHSKAACLNDGWSTCKTCEFIANTAQNRATPLNNSNDPAHPYNLFYDSIAEAGMGGSEQTSSRSWQCGFVKIPNTVTYYYECSVGWEPKKGARAYCASQRN